MVTITGGEKLKAKLAEISRNVSRKRTLRVGFLEGATYAPTEGDPTPLNVPTVAAMNNYGTGNIPARPFFTDMVKEKSPDWGDQLGNVLKANDYDAEKSLELMGEGIAGQLRESIINTMAPPLSMMTLLARKRRSEGKSVTGATLGEFEHELRKGPANVAGVSTKPLIDTGHMLASVDKEVE